MMAREERDREILNHSSPKTNSMAEPDDASAASTAPPFPPPPHDIASGLPLRFRDFGVLDNPEGNEELVGTVTSVLMDGLTLKPLRKLFQTKKSINERRRERLLIAGVDGVVQQVSNSDRLRSDKTSIDIEQRENFY